MRKLNSVCCTLAAGLFLSTGCGGDSTGPASLDVADLSGSYDLTLTSSGLPANPDVSCHRVSVNVDAHSWQAVDCEYTVTPEPATMRADSLVLDAPELQRPIILSNLRGTPERLSSAWVGATCKRVSEEVCEREGGTAEWTRR